MSKCVCVLPVMEFNDEYFLYAIDSVINSVDYLIFSVNERSWGNSEIKLTNENRKFIEDFVKTNPKFKLMIGNWAEEHLQHNSGIDYALSLGADLIFCTSCDQVYGEGDVTKMLDMLENSDADILRAQWYTFWKKTPLCVVWPPEPFIPILAFRPKQFRYQAVSEGKAIDKNGNFVDPKSITLGINDVKVFHFSFAHDDEFIKHKMEMSSHRHQMVPNWYENVWKKFKPGDKNLHPCWPSSYQSAVTVSLDMLPPKVRGYFKMLGEQNRWRNVK